MLCNANGTGCLIMMDSNCWLGFNYFKSDPNPQNENSKLFQNFLDRNESLSVLNLHPSCEGVITRSRIVMDKTEKSCLDFLLVCDKMLPFFERMVIDEKKELALSNFRGKTPKKAAKTSDHNVIIAEFGLKYSKNKTEETETKFNFNDEEGMKLYRQMTSRKGFFTKYFTSNKPFTQQFNQWERTFKKCLSRCFKKIRVGKQRVNSNKVQKSKLFKLMKDRKHANIRKEQNKMDEIEDNIREEERQYFKEEIEKDLNVVKTLGFSRGMWKLRNKYFPKKCSSLPVAKLNEEGQIITNKNELKNLYLKHYCHRMRSRPMKSDMENVKLETEKFFSNILQKTKLNKTPDWTLKELEKVLGSLKLKQSHDMRGYTNELFHTKNIGDDLKESILKICNKIKEKLIIPKTINQAYISSIPKKKKNKLDLNSERGIFMVNKLRSILIKLVYNSKVDILEENLSSSNIGARKNKAPRDHLYVLLAIVNDVIRTKNKDPIEIVYYDVKQAFDSLWTEKSYLDLHENGLNDDMLNLLHETSKEVEICVKSQVGVTEKDVIRDIILQGETVSSIICTSSVDLMSKQCPLEVYKYREVVDIPKLSFVDDIADVTKCGKSAKDMNEFTSIEISKRKLQLATDKCQKMHVGRE